MRDYTSTSPLSYTSAFRKNTCAKRKQFHLYNQQRRVICTNITNHGLHTTANKSIRVAASLQNTHFSWEFEHFWKVNDQKHSTTTNLAFLPHICVHQQSILFEDWPHQERTQRLLPKSHCFNAASGKSESNMNCTLGKGSSTILLQHNS